MFRHCCCSWFLRRCLAARWWSLSRKSGGTSACRLASSSALAFASNAWERFPRALSSLDAMSFHVSTVVFASSLRAWPISLSNVAFAARVASSDGFASVDAFTALSNASRHFLLASINGLALTSRSTLPASVRVRFVALSALVESRSDSLMDRPARLDRMSLPFDATRSRSVSTSLSSTPALSASPTVVFALPLHAASWLMDACARS